jgi:hypothetical protein
MKKCADVGFLAVPAAGDVMLVVFFKNFFKEYEDKEKRLIEMHNLVV